jgi:hypothetical protein
VEVEINDEKPKNASGYRNAYFIVKKMRWVALVLGPLPILWDNVMFPTLNLFAGIPSFMTMEDFFHMLFVDLLPMDKYSDEFEMIWPHLTRVCTILFVVFVIWAIVAKKKALAAKEASIEDRIEAEVERRVAMRLSEMNHP